MNVEKPSQTQSSSTSQGPASDVTVNEPSLLTFEQILTKLAEADKMRMKMREMQSVLIATLLSATQLKTDIIQDLLLIESSHEPDPDQGGSADRLTTDPSEAVRMSDAERGSSS